MKLKNLFFLFFPILINGQNINLNNDFNNQLIRYSVLANEIKTELSFNVRPLSFNSFSDVLSNQYKTILSNQSNTIQIKTLGIDYFIEYNSHHPYNRNNGTMIPKRSTHNFTWILLKLFSIQFKPEHHFSENKIEDFGKVTILQFGLRYRLWNHIDMPEIHIKS